MARRCEAKQKVIDAVRKMPPLYHKKPDEEFDYRKARTLWWIVKQPEVLKYLWNMIKQSGVIIYDKDTGKWHGIDWNDDD